MTNPADTLVAEVREACAGHAGSCSQQATAACDRYDAARVEPFQARVQPWMMACFGPEISGDPEERNHRFIEEALELVQSTGCTASEAHQLVDYVYGRPVGEPVQEVGGVMVTLAALCLANRLDMHEAAETELARIWTKVEAIRAKQAAKPKHSPLPCDAARVDEAGRAYGSGYEWYRNKWVGDHEEMCADGPVLCSPHPRRIQRRCWVCGCYRGGGEGLRGLPTSWLPDRHNAVLAVPSRPPRRPRPDLRASDGYCRRDFARTSTTEQATPRMVSFR